MSDVSNIMCGPESICLTPDGKLYSRCGCGAFLLPGELFAHIRASERASFAAVWLNKGRLHDVL